jgi:hypothetical protein
MTTNKEKQIAAIALLEECSGKVQELLAGAPMLQLGTRHALSKLANQIKIAAGVGPGATTEKRESKPLTHLFGKPIGGAAMVVHEPATVSPDVQLKELEYLGAIVVADIKAGAIPADILEKHGEKAVRAAAAMSGLDVTATEPARVTTQLVADIFNKIQDDADRAEQARKAAEAAAATNSAPIEPEQEQQTVTPVIPEGDKVEVYGKLKGNQAAAAEVLKAAEEAVKSLTKNASKVAKGEAERKLAEAEAAMKSVTLALEAHTDSMSEEEFALATQGAE